MRLGASCVATVAGAGLLAYHALWLGDIGGAIASACGMFGVAYFIGPDAGDVARLLSDLEHANKK